MALERAVEIFKRGGLVMIYDGEDREGEVDFVMRADAVTPRVIKWLRQNAGGLLCFATTREIGETLGLSFLNVYYRERGFRTKAPYGDEPAFMGYVNHVRTKTGVRDTDKALTIRELARVVSLAEKYPEKAQEEFVQNFYMPGHVPILGARLGERQGHTELSITLAQLAGVPPAVILIEALGDSQEAITFEEAKELAKTLGIPLLTARDLQTKV